MNVSALVDAAVTLDRQIRELEAALKDLKRDLVAVAAGRRAELRDIPDGGQSLDLVGDSGAVARVIFPKERLAASLDLAGPAGTKLRATAGPEYCSLFVCTSIVRPIENFRARAAALLGPERAEKVIALVTSRSAPRVLFETKPAAEEPE